MMYKFVENKDHNLVDINLFCGDCGTKKEATKMSWQLVNSIWPTAFSALSSCEDEFFRKLVGYFVDTDLNPSCSDCGKFLDER